MESNDLTSGNYSIEVEDFGPIVHAHVDLRPLTVFVGPSNTRKSYLAILIYALLNATLMPRCRAPVQREAA